MYDFEKPLSFHIELTDKCNARCVQCSRNFVDNDGKLKERPELCLTEISLEQYKSIFKNYQNKSKGVNFCGNMGDPVFAKDIFEISEYTLSNVINDYYLTGAKRSYGAFKVYTNGGMRSKKWWLEYGKLLKDKKAIVNFAIDGLEDTHHIYRTNTRYHRVIENARAYIEGGGRAEWSFIRFGHNQHQEEECRKLAQQYGFTQFTAVNTQRFYSREKISYNWQGKDYSILRYKPESADVTEFKNLDRTNKLWDGKKLKDLSADEVNVNTQKSLNKFMSDPETIRKQSAGTISCHTANRNDVFIDCMGYVHPCCWIGSNEYHRITNMQSAKRKIQANKLGNYLLENRDFEPAWEKDFIDILKTDWYQYVLPLSWEVSPCTICARQCGKTKYTTLRQHEYLNAK
jgi:MoaA/NifB/PqqE/SkfB family radical SAM enzyme|tara:strand:- start:1861 stop:3063 length:1203 start_codon:yes stop_codon:yes gene_type:complete